MSLITRRHATITSLSLKKQKFFQIPKHTTRGVPTNPLQNHSIENAPTNGGLGMDGPPRTRTNRLPGRPNLKAGREGVALARASAPRGRPVAAGAPRGTTRAPRACAPRAPPRPAPGPPWDCAPVLSVRHVWAPTFPPFAIVI